MALASDTSATVRRELEAAIRRAAVALAVMGVRRGTSIETVAAGIGLRGNTLREWSRRASFEAGPRGRPKAVPPPRLRNVVIAVLRAFRAGLPMLREIFEPLITRAALDEIRARFIRVQKCRGAIIFAQKWLAPGRVWAMDFTDPDRPLHGYAALLVVRDLASGCQLAAEACFSPDEASVVRILTRLFLKHGAPLVLKSDNGSALIGSHVADLLARFRVLPLLSPPAFPQYNGACEAGIGGLKRRIEDLSARGQCPWRWSLDEVEAARLLGNRTPGEGGATPEDLWEQRSPVRADERTTFLGEVAEQRIRLRNELQTREVAASEALFERVAIARALAERKVLEVRRRRISPSIRMRFRSNNS